MMIKRYKTFLTDFVWSFAALLVMNMALQLLIYPLINKILGSERNGDILYLIGVINIIGISVGTSANNSRLKLSLSKKNIGKYYDLFLIGSFLIFLPIAYVVLALGGETTDFCSVISYWLLICATTYRNYADVEYRLTVNYKGYFIYYLIISLGYLLGIGIFYVTHIWFIIFLVGEISGILFVLYQKKKNAIKVLFEVQEAKSIFVSIITLVSAQLCVNAVLNSDRLVLKFFVNSTAVTIYYIASLLGKIIAMVSAPLNSVIIGHLSKKEGDLSANAFLKVAGLLTLGVVGILGVSVLGSHIYVYLFYPQEYAVAKALFLPANTAQIIYFSTGILNTLLLRYISEKYQLYMNILYVMLFGSMVVSGMVLWGLQGFAISFCCVNILRFMCSVIVGYVKLSQIGKREK